MTVDSLLIVMTIAQFIRRHWFILHCIGIGGGVGNVVLNGINVVSTLLTPSDLFPFETYRLSLHFCIPLLTGIKYFHTHWALIPVFNITSRQCVHKCLVTSPCFWWALVAGYNFESIIRPFKLCSWTGNDDNDRGETLRKRRTEVFRKKRGHRSYRSHVRCSWGQESSG